MSTTYTVYDELADSAGGRLVGSLCHRKTRAESEAAPIRAAAVISAASYMLLLPLKWSHIFAVAYVNT
jgi:hypothetical protein